eukprot:UN17838
MSKRVGGGFWLSDLHISKIVRGEVQNALSTPVNRFYMKPQSRAVRDLEPIRLSPFRHELVRLSPFRHELVRLSPFRHELVRLSPFRHELVRLR